MSITLDIFHVSASPPLSKASATKNYDELVGKRVKKAREAIVVLLKEENSSVDGTTQALIKDPEPIEHPVKFYEKGDSPVELIPTRQWFIDILSSKKD